jgi:hypothetical protein
MASDEHAADDAEFDATDAAMHESPGAVAYTRTERGGVRQLAIEDAERGAYLSPGREDTDDTAEEAPNRGRARTGHYPPPRRAAGR